MYLHVLRLGTNAPELCNAGFENLSVLEVAKRITESVPAEIVVTESNDPRSYRLNSDRLLATGFVSRFGIEDGIREVCEAFHAGRLQDEERWYNVRTMKARRISS